MSPDRSIALAIFAKYPRAGACKTRLTSICSSGAAASLSRSFIRDTAQNVREVSTRTASVPVALHTGCATAAELVELFGEDFAFVEQRGGSFGERLQNGTHDLFAAGHAAAVVIDSDSPTLPAVYLARAVAELRGPGARAVIGPAADGGYYLLGMNVLLRTVFEQIDWSTERVFAQTIERLRSANCRIAILPQWYDVDDESGLEALAREFAHCEPAGGYAAPYTRAHLAVVR